MSDWLVKVVGVIIITSCAEMLLPVGKIKNSCRTVLAIICIAVFIEPLYDFAGANINFDSVLGNVQIDEEYVSETADYYCSVLENEVETALEKENYIVKECNIQGKIENGKFTTEKVEIKIDIKVISEKDEHIIGNEVSKNVAEYLGITLEKVFVYGER